MGNPFVHIELNTGDLDAAKRFYKKLFDWKLEDLAMDAGSYTMIDVGEGAGGGMQENMLPESPAAWLAYVEVKDVRKTIEAARKLGAQIVADYMDLGPMGSAGIFIDPTGATLGVWAPAAKKRSAKKAAKKVAKKVAKRAGDVAKAAKKVAKKAVRKARR